MKISAVYKITNTVTNDCYIGSSKNVKDRWAHHKCPSTWKNYPNKQLYKDMQNYGVDKFDFQILANVEPEQLKETEQQFIEKLKPTYNNINAKGWDVERQKKYHKKYFQSEKGKETKRKSNKKYRNQLCSYKGETITLNALVSRFYRAGVGYPVAEAKKYLLNK